MLLIRTRLGPNFQNEAFKVVLAQGPAESEIWQATPNGIE